MTYSILLMMRNRLFTIISSGAFTDIFSGKKKEIANKKREGGRSNLSIGVCFDENRGIK